MSTRNTSTPSSPSNRQTELMARARATASFLTQDMTCIIYGSPEAAKRKEVILRRVEKSMDESDPNTLPRIYGEMNRTQMYRNGLRQGRVLMEDEIAHHHQAFRRATHRYALINGSPLGLHTSLFIPTLNPLAPLAEQGKIIGTYCQTELGHGTFLRGLETTATFDMASDEFIIHSPTLTSTKYWPGGLGLSCSHAIVMARLIVSGEDHGIHSFMVQLRSLDNYRPLAGIELGDVGLKMGLNGTDNGYAVFDRVRIPRMNLLMGNARLLRDGTYLKAPHTKHTYGTMLHARNIIVEIAAFQLAQAVTIATRYSVVREQGNVSIMNYKSQHYRLLVLMSRAFALAFAAKTCDTLYNDLVARQQTRDHSTLPYGHITTAALKAYATQIAADGCEDARKCCGGHGYSVLSGLPEIVSVVTPMATLEGENYVMYQQTARYLVKCVDALRRGASIDSPMAYLEHGSKGAMNSKQKECVAHKGSEFMDPDIQLAIFSHRAVRLAFTYTRKSWLRRAWNLHMMPLISAARAHIEYFVLRSFLEAISRIHDTPSRKVLHKLCSLFALSTIESPLSIGSLEFFEDGYISSTQLRIIRSQVNEILSDLLPEAIGLTDAWNFSDASLQSALGRKDGNVYETLMSWTRQLPINRNEPEDDMSFSSCSDDTLPAAASLGILRGL
ncbi:acyl-CoA dehydrogenase/oxidase C-terminal [Infundibulicybe gibba]|nr:acyl-CoA dehydrogenase/oxidase C-terminal [Infundibulicybe gibba]